VFLPSQQGLLRGDDGHDASASSLTSARTQRDRPSSAPTAFSLGLLGFFLPPTHPAFVVNRTGGIGMRAVVLVFLLVAARPGVMSLRDSQTETWRHSDVTVSGLGPLAKPFPDTT